MGKSAETPTKPAIGDKPEGGGDEPEKNNGEPPTKKPKMHIPSVKTKKQSLRFFFNGGVWGGWHGLVVGLGLRRMGTAGG